MLASWKAYSKESVFEVGKRELHLRIAGCGKATQLVLEGQVVFVGFSSVTLKNMSILALKVPNPLTLDRCSEVTMHSCRL